VFEFYDDFNGDSLDTSKWDIQRGSNDANNECVLSPSEGVIYLTKAVNNKGCAIYPQSNFSEDFVMDMRFKAGGGDGADEVIDTIFRTFVDDGDEVIIPIPTFTQYRISATIHNANIKYAKYDKERDFKLDVESVLANITDKTKVIFLCTPNNPTGNIIENKDIERIINETDALVVIDHAYIEYAKKEYDWTQKAPEYDNVIVLRTFSKVFGLAGMRVGYGVANKKIIDYMMRVKPVFSLTRLSQICAITALRDREFFERCVRDGIKSREMLYNGLKRFKDIKVYPSEANYLLVELKTMKAKEFCEELLKRGVIV